MLGFVGSVPSKGLRPSVPSRDLDRIPTTSGTPSTLEKFVQPRGGDVGALSPQAVGQLRSKIRNALSEELDQIDTLVCEILTES